MTPATTALGDVLRVKHGFAFKGVHFKNEGDRLVLTPGNFRIGGGLQIRDGKERFYSAPYPSEFELRSGDLLIAMTDLTQGAPILGSPLVVPDRGPVYLHNQRLGKIVGLDESQMDRSYLYYVFVWDGTRAQLRATATGATVRHTAPERVYRVRIPLPPLLSQRKIAAILRAYDALIENNIRRIQILEEMAQRIYREWFVDFRYRGRGVTELLTDDAGPIPMGWSRLPVSEVADVTYGFPFKSQLFNTKGRGLPLVRIRDLPTNASATWTTEEAPAEYEIADGDILVGMDGDFHMCKWSSGRAYLNQRVCRFRPQPGRLSRYVLFLALEEPIRDWNQTIVGTTVAHLLKSHIDRIRILVPDRALLRLSETVFEPIFEEEVVLRRQTSKLRRSRELLLPRLMSGEIDVDDLGIVVEEPAA